MKDEELLTFEDRTYVNPEVGQQEALSFIDTLRGLQAQNNAQINQQTYNLGTQVPSNLGGLTGSEGAWQARYQTPQMNAAVANLQNTARQTALNTALSNQEAMWKNRYNQAKRALEKAQHKFSTKPTTTPDTTDDGLQIDTESPSIGDLVVEEAQMSIPENKANMGALEQAVSQAASSGNPNMAGSNGITYTENGVQYYVVLYRNAVGAVTGGSVYTASGGALTPLADYNQSGISNLLNNAVRSGNKLYDMYGSDISTSWGLI